MALDHKLQHTLHAAVEECQIQCTVLYGFQNSFILAVLPRLKHVVSCYDGGHGIFSGIPVGHHQSLESPFVAEDVFCQFAVLAGIFAVHLIVGGHHAPGLRLFDSNLEALQIQLAQGALCQARVVVIAVGLLVVHGKVFQAGTCPPALDSIDIGSSPFTSQHRIFRIIFMVTSAKHISHQVDTRCQQHIQTIILHFHTQSTSHLMGCIRIESSCHRGAGREFRSMISTAVEFPLGSHRQPVRSVGKIGGRDTQSGNVVSTSRCSGKLGITSHRHPTTDDEVYLLFEGHSTDHFVDIVGTQSD